jgi:carboxylesterase
MIIETAEPFFFLGGSTGCLLVHGFTGTPKEMRLLGEDLAARGYTVLGVRLMGHATRPEDLPRARWEDWLAAVEDGWHLLNGAAGRIFVMGLSLGGCLSLLFASRFPVAGVVAMSAPYALRDDPRLPYIELLSHLTPRKPKGPPDWRDPTSATGHVDYPYYPTRSLAELRDVLVEMRRSLPKVTAPVLLAHARGDTGGGSFDPESMPKIYAGLGSAAKEMLWLEDSGHVITRDQERPRLFDAIADFIEKSGKDAGNL